MSAAAAPAPAAADRASILEAPTPPAWVEDALSHLPELLLDHANCEKKAASSALALMFAYAEDTRLALALARLAREELKHFEQVQKALGALGVAFARQRPGRYAHGLRSVLRSGEPCRKL
ncbi:MAG: tRNA-(ms[2]io[6]A)-hydroxylase, partial [Gammaproteobacteria bacterium]